MGYRFEESVTINAPRELVWDIAQSLERRTEWDARVVSAGLLSPAPVNRGSIFQVTVKMYGIKFRSVAEFVNWAPSVRSGIKTLDGHGNLAKVVGSWNFRANEDGSTTFKTTIAMEMEAGFFLRLFEQQMGRTFHMLTRQSLQNLKRLAEAECAMRVRHEAEVLV